MRALPPIGVKQMPEFTILALLWLFVIVALEWSADGDATIRVMISVLQKAQIPTPTVAGMIMLLTYATSIGWLLPINRPQNVLAFGTDTFEARGFIRVGLRSPQSPMRCCSYSPQPGGTGLAMGRTRRLRALLQERGESGTAADAVYRALRHGIVPGILRRASDCGAMPSVERRRS
jgi:hypothetical protein